MPFQPDQLHAVVFDMDGILIDTEYLYEKSAIQAAKEHGFLLSEELHRSIVGFPQEICDSKIREAMGPDFPFEKYNHRYSQILTAEFQRNIPVKPGVRELLALLTIRGIPTAVSTSSSRKVTTDHLTRTKLISYFSSIVTRDDVSKGKPHPEPYLRAAELLGVKPENCLALEDSHNGVRSANGAGMQTIMVPDMLPATEEITGLCIAIMTDLHQVRDRFEAN